MLGQELRHAARALGRRPAFATAVVLTLALGIGGASAIFGIVDAALLRALPYGDVDRLYELWAKLPNEIQVPIVSREVLEVWREQDALFERVEAQETGGVVATGLGEPRHVRASYLTPGALELLDVPALRGRYFTERESVEGGPGVVLLGESYWREALGSDPGIVGRTIQLDDAPHEVIGIMPRRFRYPLGSAQVILPLIASEWPSVTPVVKLREGVTMEQAQARVDAIAASLEAERPRRNGWGVGLHAVDDRNLPGNAKTALWFLAGAVLGVLLIGCVNAANLFLVHGASRSRELAVRRALGATRGRLVRAMLLESLILAGCAAALGVGIGAIGVQALAAIAPPSFIAFSAGDIRIDARVYAFAAALALVTAALFGVVPSLIASRSGASLAGGERAASGGAGVRRLRAGLAIAELALAMTLLVAAGLLARSMTSLLGRDVGFDPENLVVVDLSLPSHRYAEADAQAAFYDALLERLRALPGVAAVSIADAAPPAAGFSFGVTLEAEGAPPADEGQPELLPTVRTDEAYFDVLGIPLVAGRAFDARDRAGAPLVAIVDENLARFLWPDGGAVGRRFRLSERGDWHTVVGVARDIALFGYAETRANICSGGACEFEVYRPLAQSSLEGQQSITLRSAVEAAELAPLIRDAVWSLDAALPVASISTVRQRFSESLDEQRFVARLTTLFTAFALLLAAVGVYGVLAYAVARRTRELGIRIALGARAADVMRGVLATTAAFAAVGIVLGVGGALAASRVMRTLIFDIAPTDPIAIGAAAAVLAAVAVLAALGPARRAVRISPLEALRVE